MIDKDLFIAENLRPAITPNAAVTRWLFPDLVTPTYLDLLSIIDWARANPVFANFRIDAAFDNVAANFLRFAIFVDSVPTFLNVLTNNELVIARGPDILSAGLGAGSVGSEVTVAMPPLNYLAKLTTEGRRHVTLGIEAYVPAADWSTGGITAFFSPHALPPKPASYASGY